MPNRKINRHNNTIRYFNKKRIKKYISKWNKIKSEQKKNKRKIENVILNMPWKNKMNK